METQSARNFAIVEEKTIFRVRIQKILEKKALSICKNNFFHYFRNSNVFLFYEHEHAKHFCNMINNEVAKNKFFSQFKLQEIDIRITVNNPPPRAAYMRKNELLDLGWFYAPVGATVEQLAIYRQPYVPLAWKIPESLPSLKEIKEDEISLNDKRCNNSTQKSESSKQEFANEKSTSSFTDPPRSALSSPNSIPSISSENEVGDGKLEVDAFQQNDASVLAVCDANNENVALSRNVNEMVVPLHESKIPPAVKLRHKAKTGEYEAELVDKIIKFSRKEGTNEKGIFYHVKFSGYPSDEDDTCYYTRSEFTDLKTLALLIAQGINNNSINFDQVTDNALKNLVRGFLPSSH